MANEPLNQTVRGNDIKCVEAVEQNISLVVGQFNSKAYSKESVEEEIKTMDDAFRTFKPSVEVEFKAGQEPETLYFNCMDDFEAKNGEGKLVQNSQYLSKLKTSIDTSSKMLDTIQQNTQLRALLENCESREELKIVLEQMLHELEENQ